MRGKAESASSVVNDTRMVKFVFFSENKYFYWKYFRNYLNAVKN